MLGIHLSSYYYKAHTSPEREILDERDMKIINTIWTEHPQYGQKQMYLHIYRNCQIQISRKRVRNLMQRMNIRAIVPTKFCTVSNREHRKYPNRIRGVEITRVNQLWVSDLTYITICGGRVYLIAIIDVYSRKVLAWKLSNTMDAESVQAVLEDAMLRFGIPEIFHSDQGSQYTSKLVVEFLETNMVQISMSSIGRALDNIIIERFWKSFKYEDVYIKRYGSIPELKAGIETYMKFYNEIRPHQSLGGHSPSAVYTMGIGGSNYTLKAA